MAESIALRRQDLQLQIECANAQLAELDNVAVIAPEFTVCEGETGLLLTTNNGMEDIVEREVNSLLASGGHQYRVVLNPFEFFGFVGVVCRSDQFKAICSTLESMRSVHDVLHFHHHIQIEPPRPEATKEEIKEHSGGLPEKLKAALDVPSLIGAKSFRVSCEREGNHPFQSTDVELEVGAVLHTRYSVKGSMKEYEVNVRVVIFEMVAVVATQLNKSALSKRHKLAFTRTVTLKPNVAFAMLQLAQFRPGMSLLDPCCGSGTILLEAAEICQQSPAAPRGKIIGCDRSGACITGSVQNAAAAGLAELVQFQKANARGVDKLFDHNSFDCVVTNLPWGVQVSKGADLNAIYRGILYAASSLLRPGGRFVGLVLRMEMMLEVIRSTGIYIFEHVRVVRTGEMSPALFVVRLRPIDAERAIVKSGIAILNEHNAIATAALPSAKAAKRKRSKK